VFGTLEVQPLASQIFGLYTGLAYLTPILGGALADRVFGQRAMAVIGALLMAVGHFMMAFEALLFVALLFLILGIGAFKPNVSTQVGALMLRTIRGGCAPMRSTMSASISARSWRRSCAGRSAAKSAGTMASRLPESGW